MPFRSDIIRGVRLAAAGLAVLLLAVLVKRTISSEPTAVAAPAVQAAEIAPALPSPEPPAPVIVPDPPSLVPDAPPKQGVVNRASVRRAKPAAVKPPRVELPQAVETLSAPPPAVEPVVERKEVAEAPVPVAEPAPVAAPPAPPEPTVVAAPAEGRGKRMIKAVGRFFGIGGKKDAEPQPARPKQNQ